MRPRWKRAGRAALTAALIAVGMTAQACGQPSGPVTPTGETPAETGWRLAEVTRGLMHPWGAVWLPDGRTMLITEREGRPRVVEDGVLRRDVVEGVPEVFASGQGGLMDVALHPDFERTRWVYLTMSTGSGQANRTELVRGRLREDLSRLEDVERLFRVNADKRGGQHFGSRLLWLEDGSLLMSVGDGGNPPIRHDGRLIREFAQDTSWQLGKVLRMNENGEALDDSPFAGDDEGDPYVYSYGHRNIQGMAIRPGTTEVWATEHGARGGDELNLIRPERNYGWPEVTYSVEYRGPRISDETSREGMVDPLVVWTPCIAPSGLAFYEGEDFPEWQGDLFAGGLVLRQIRRIDFEDGDIAGQTTLQLDDRGRWVGTGPDGEMYVLTDEIDGGLFRIEPTR